MWRGRGGEMHSHRATLLNRPSGAHILRGHIHQQVSHMGFLEVIATHPPISAFHFLTKSIKSSSG